MKNWEKKKLGEVCIVERGSSPRPIEKYQTNSPDGVNWIKIGDTKGVDKYIFSTREKITKEGAEKSRYVKEGDFILSNSMSFGKPYIMKTDGYIHDGWFVFRLPDYLDKDFFYHLLTSPNVQEQIQSLGAGAIVKNISGDLVKKVDITFPKSLSEQQRIVVILDEALAAIAKAKANAEQNLKNAKELFESYLQGVFENGNWERKRIDEICTLINGRAYNKQELLSEGKYTVLRVGNFFTNNHWYYSDLELPEDKYCEEGDLLYAWSASFGPRIWKGEKVIYHYHIWKVIPNLSLVRKEFLFILFEWDKEKIKASQGTGTTMMHVSKGSMEERIIPLPPLKEQQTIVQKLDALSTESKKIEAIYQQKINDLEELKKSILQKAFSGELKTSKELTV